MARVIVDDLVVEYVTDGYAVRALDGLSFEAEPGELVVLLGPSGCGKTTLLSCLGGILTPTSGRIVVGDLEVTALSGGRLDEYRRERIGFVFQAFNLIPSLTARENIAVPLALTGWSRHAATERADELLAVVGLAERAEHKPAKLSGGQQQRVAVARGLGHDPKLLLADEPTANLDQVQAESVIRLLRNVCDDGRTVVVSTHDARLVPIADRIVRLVAEPEEPHEIAGPVLLDPGQVLFEQGDPSDYVYVVDEGEIEIVRVLADGDEELMARVGAGQYFGELGPLLGFQRSGTARAATAASLTKYSTTAFRELALDGA